MEIGTVTISLDEYLELRKLKEDVLLNHTYLIHDENGCGGNNFPRYTAFKIITKDEAIIGLTRINKELSDKLSQDK